MNEKNLSRSPINSLCAFYAFLSAIFCSFIGFSLFQSAWYILSALFLCFLLFSLPSFFPKKVISISYILGILLATIIFYSHLLFAEFEYKKYEENISISCEIQEKRSETLFVCNNFLITLSSGNSLEKGDKIEFHGTKILLSQKDYFSLLSNGFYVKYKGDDFNILEKYSNTSIDIFLKNLSKHINSLFPQRESALLHGMLLGNGNYFDNNLKNTYKSSGLSHLVVASGSNIILVLSFFLIFLKPISAKIRIPILLIAIWGYCFIAGMQIPLLRAACMSTSMLLFFSKKLHGISILLLVAFLFWIENPFIFVFNGSFQLSFLATLWLLLLSTPLQNFIKKLHIPSFLNEIISSSITATIFTLPITLFSFWNFAPYGIFANILAAPLVPFTLLFWIISLFWDYIHPLLGTYCGLLSYFWLGSINFIAIFINNFPSSLIRVETNYFAPIFFSLFFPFIWYSIFMKIQKKMDFSTL